MGSGWGTMLGGVILGVAQLLGARAFGPAWQIVVGPRGLHPHPCLETSGLPSEDGDVMRTTTPTPEGTGSARTSPYRWPDGRTTSILAFGLAILIVLAVFPFFGVTEWTRRLIDLFCFLALAQLWNLMLGYAGLISAGQQGFIGIGAYTLWFFSDILHISPFAAVVFAAIAGMIIALPAAALVFRLKGGYLAIGTWVIAEVIRLIVTNVKRAGGGSGIDVTSAGARSRSWAPTPGTPASTGGPLRRRCSPSRSPTCCSGPARVWALKAMRDNDLAAESNGVNLWRTKLYTWVIAGAGCALVGAIQAMYALRVNPGSNFSINWTAYLIFIWSSVASARSRARSSAPSSSTSCERRPASTAPGTSSSWASWPSS